MTRATRERNPQLLRVGLGPRSPGVYRVLWRILAVEGHRNEGTYVFARLVLVDVIFLHYLRQDYVGDTF